MSERASLIADGPDDAVCVCGGFGCDECCGPPNCPGGGVDDLCTWPDIEGCGLCMLGKNPAVYGG